MDKRDIDSIINVIENEIKWCEKNHTTGSRHYQDGFIYGLKQAIFLIKKLYDGYKRSNAVNYHSHSHLLPAKENRKV